MKELELRTMAPTWSKKMATKRGGEPNWENLCILHCIFRDYTFNNFNDDDRSPLYEYLRSLEKHYKDYIPGDSVEPGELMDQVLLEFQAKGNKLGLTGKIIETTNFNISRVISDQSFYTHCLSPTLKRGYSGDGGLNRLANHLQIPEFRKLIREGMEGNAQGKYEWVFVTTSQSLTGVDVEDILSKLGKTIKGNTGWIELRYPDDFLNHYSLRIPTILSVGANGLFRAKVKDTDDWGKTVCISDLGDGFPEAVHEKCPVNNQYDPRFLGRTEKAHDFNQWFKLLQTNKTTFTRNI